MKNVFVLLLLLNSLSLNAQHDIYFNSKVLHFYNLSGMEKEIGLPANYVLGFAITENEDSLLIISGKMTEENKDSIPSEDIRILGLVLNDYSEYFFNEAKMNGLYWRKDTIYISSQFPYKATYFYFEFIWNDVTKKFDPTESKSYDPSEEAVIKADSLLSIGKISAAINQYYQVMYPHAYINEGEVGIRLMECAHKKSLEFFKESKFDSAIVYMDLAIEYYPNSDYTSFDNYSEYAEFMSDSLSWQWSPDQVKLWLGDYGLFLYKAKKYTESIEFNSYLNMILPDVAGPYLQLGDSYFDSSKKAEAKTAYKKYSDLKKAQKKEKEIPKRVKERTK